MFRHAFLALGAFVAVTSSFAALAQNPATVYLDDLMPLEEWVGWDRLRINRTVDGDDAVELGGKKIGRFLEACANSRLVYELPPDAARFQAVGVSTKKFKDNASWSYEVWADANLLFRSRVLNTYNPREIKIDVAIPPAAKRLMLVIDNDSSGTGDHSVWAEPCLILGGPVTPPVPRNVVSKLPAAQLDGVVLVEGDRSVGTGFFAFVRGQPFIVTNQHVLAGNKTLRIANRTGLRPTITGYLFAQDRDLALLRIETDTVKFPLLTIAASATAAAVGSDLLVAGNSEGGGTILQSEGRVVGFGPDRLEHDIATVSGNSGSPVFQQSTWEVVAIDTYSRIRRASPATDPASRGSSGSSLADIRHFGVRIDSVREWQAVSWDLWQKDCADLDALERRIEGVEKFLTEERSAWITYPDIARRVQAFEDKARGMPAGSQGFRREASSFFESLLNYAQNQQRAAIALRERSIGYLHDRADNLASYAGQLEGALRAWDVSVADRLKLAAK